MSSPQQKLNAMAITEAIKESRDNYLVRLELFAIIANEIKSKFDALVSAGFTAEQAMELCKAKAI